MVRYLPFPFWAIQAVLFIVHPALAASSDGPLGLPVVETNGSFSDVPSESRPLLERVSFAHRSDGQGYVIRFHLTAAVPAYTEPQEIDGGLQMILFNTGLAQGYRSIDPDGPVSTYSAENASGHLVFRFQLDPTRQVNASAYRDRATHDLLVGLTYRSEPRELAAGTRDASHVAPTPVIPVATSSDAPPAVPAAPAGARSAEAERWLLDTIVIDAGHGGKDPGAAANGVREKDVTLGVALKLGEYIRENLGINVVYTRSDDRFIELRDRGRLANAQGGKLFISIHANAAPNSSAAGTETYFLGMHRSDAARRTMERENSVVKLESDPNQYERLTEQELIRMELTHSAFMRKSEDLSQRIERQFAERVQRTSRGVKQAGFYVLWGASMPAVLVELGFLTNPVEAAFLASESGQAYMASAIFRAVKEYKEEYEKGLTAASFN